MFKSLAEHAGWDEVAVTSFASSRIDAEIAAAVEDTDGCVEVEATAFVTLLSIDLTLFSKSVTVTSSLLFKTRLIPSAFSVYMP